MAFLSYLKRLSLFYAKFSMTGQTGFIVLLKLGGGWMCLAVNSYSYIH